MADNIESKATVASEEIEAEECQEDVPEEGKIIRKDEKSRLNVEVLDDAETVTLEQRVYQIRPQLHEKFKPLNAKEVIHNVLFDQLSAKTYDAQEAAQWTKDIADLIREKVKELKFKRYKYIVNVVLGEQHGAGVKMGTRCIWDAEADTYAYDSFLNVRVAQLILIS
ncbi:dynein light chain Tctex-type protein 2B-like [Bombus affinis]|uniref:dynein light chain Tctex-type protein 2B-like n=1 Tax=Bombus affinis TaxID=309941 RepID=UPI0021B7BAB1|nr:dynein light chain Tctex-type protein 2B-like [Bombus affinis]